MSTHAPTFTARHPRVASLVTKRPRLTLKVTIAVVMVALFLLVGVEDVAAEWGGSGPGP